MIKTSLIKDVMTAEHVSLGQTVFSKGMLAIATITAVGLSLISSAVAQTSSDVDPLEDFQTQDSSGDVLSGNSQQAIQDLIHQLNLNVGLSMEDFAVQRHDNILSEADRFREMQRTRIEQEQNVIEANPSTPEDVEDDL